MTTSATVFDWLYNALRWTWQDPDGYNFISGPLADITLLGGAYAILRHHNCHAKGCWRIGRHPVDGTGYASAANTIRTQSRRPSRSMPSTRPTSRMSTTRAATAAAATDVRHVAGDVHRVAHDAHVISEAASEPGSPSPPHEQAD
jgi:hypothetical protein